MTRDSWLLKVLLLLSVILTALSAFTPEYLGVSDLVAHRLTALGAVIAAVSGWLQTSPLKGDNDTNKVKPSNLPVILLAIVLGASVTLSGCGGKVSPQLPTQTAALVQSADAKAKAVADHALGILDAAGKVLDEVITVEKKVEPLMSPSMKADTRKALNAVNDQIEAAAKLIKAGVRDEGAIKRAIDPVISAASNLSALVSTLPAPSQSRFGFGSLVQMLLSIVTKGAA
jgi:hypothetical protein